MADLIAWLDAQNRKPFPRVAPIDETVEAFDPLHKGLVAEDFAIPVRILEIYDRGDLFIDLKSHFRSATFASRTWTAA